MSHFITVTVTEVHESYLLLTLPDGQTINWPKKKEDSSIANARTGDTMNITLTTSTNLLNELLQDNE